MAVQIATPRVEGDSDFGDSPEMTTPPMGHSTAPSLFSEARLPPFFKHALRTQWGPSCLLRGSTALARSLTMMHLGLLRPLSDPTASQLSLHALLLLQSLDMQALNASFDHSNAAPGVTPKSNCTVPHAQPSIMHACPAMTGWGKASGAVQCMER